MLRARASSDAGRRLVTMLADNGQETGQLTFDELERRARRIAAAIQKVARPGERAVLLYPPGLDYIAGLFGAMAAGVIAVPAYPPDPTRLERTLPRLRAIVADSRATVVLTTAVIRSMAGFLAAQAPDLSALTWLATDTVEPDAEAGWQDLGVAAQDIAILQYTSGSTGTPKGAMLSHGNLVQNIRLIAERFGFREESVEVCWLPPYHDMGLIGGILTPLVTGFSLVLMQPLAFLKRPGLWLEAISRYGGTHCGGPNFAFELCARRISEQERASLDLSSWQVAFCGAEPIHAAVVERFIATFARHGFRRRAFLPCYGLAEATLLVSAKDHAQEPRLHSVQAAELEHGRAIAAPATAPKVRTLVSCGRTGDAHEIAVVDPESRRACADGVIGEVWVRGPSVAQGYWQRPDESREVFGAVRADTDDGPYLRTGDLGFIDRGELFITGRRKDLIIIRGRNHYPQDIEATAASSHAALRAGCTTAFSVEVDGEERLVIVQEVDPRRATDLDEVMGAIRLGVTEQHDVQPGAIALISPGSLPKTTSGKVQRRASKAAFLEDRLAPLQLWRA
ncbi:MAG TPA: fatty acyl-AMP ligase, partial [Kofleriaceae bacterium]|nr:fatty acyl-AMP ligase [Kofleriaceae bacterium]